MSQESKNDREPKERTKTQKILSDTGDVFETEVSARLFASKMEIDPKRMSIVKDGPGFAIEVYPRKETIADKEPCYLVTFSHQSHQNDTVDVYLAVQGEGLTIQRNKPVVVPKRFLEAADHALVPHYTQKPGQGRKIIGEVKTYEYSVIREATWEEYISQKSEGTRKTIEHQENKMRSQSESAVL